MIKFEDITKLTQEFSCTIALEFGPDGVLSIKACGPRNSDFSIIRSDWDEKIIYDCIRDVCNRVR